MIPPKPNGPPRIPYAILQGSRNGRQNVADDACEYPNDDCYDKGLDESHAVEAAECDEPCDSCEYGCDPAEAEEVACECEDDCSCEGGHECCSESFAFSEEFGGEEDDERRDDEADQKS